MHKINISKTFEKKYLDEAGALINKRIKRLLKNNNYPSFKKAVSLITSELEDFIVGTPSVLKKLNTKIEKIYQSTSTKVMIRDFLLLEKIFNYDSFTTIKKNAFYAYSLLEEIQARVCPYCDENYVFFLSEDSCGANVRGPFDHYYPKSLYPYFSISLYNLVPACTSCNSLKHNHDTIKKNLINPYEFNIESHLKFKIIVTKLSSFSALKPDNVEIYVQHVDAATSKISKSRFKRIENRFKLEARYKNHNQFICMLFHRIQFINNTLKPRFPGYTNTIFRNHLFNVKTQMYDHAPLKKLEVDFLRTYLK